MRAEPRGASARQWAVAGGGAGSAGLLCALALGAGCSHVVLIKSDPPGATVSIDGEVRGKTPLFFEEATGAGRTYHLHLSLQGHQSVSVQLEQRVWWHSCLWPSVCLMPFTLGVSGLGLLFARSLEDEYTFLLRPLSQPAPGPSTAPARDGAEAASAPGSAPAP